MARDIDLTSQEWIDLVFEGKNQKYGAYYLRRTSSRRHVMALFIVLVFGALVLIIPSFLKTVLPENTDKVVEIGPVELSDLDAKQEVPEENQIKQIENVPPPPELKATIQFTPPVIKKDEEVTAEIVTQDELTEKKDIAISVATVEGSTTGGIDIADLQDNKVVVQQEEKEQVFEHVEQMPEYPGGQTELLKYLNSNIKYPVIAQEQGIEGRVTIRFVVGKDGTVSDVRVVRSLDPSCDKEAVRVVKSLPKWIPGKQNGRPVSVYYTVPVTFKLAH